MSRTLFKTSSNGQMIRTVHAFEDQNKMAKRCGNHAESSGHQITINHDKRRSNVRMLSVICYQFLQICQQIETKTALYHGALARVN